MSRVAVKDLKSHLARYLRRTQRGEELVVTKHGTPIALIRPVQKKVSVPRAAEKLAILAAQGLVTLPTQSPLRKVRRVKVSGRPISKTIVEDRR